MWNRYKHFLLHELWHATDVGPLRRRFYALLRVLLVMGQEIASGQLTLRAMSLVYTTLLSLVPLLAVSFSVLKAFGVHNQIEPLFLTYLEPLGSRGEEVTLHILTFVDNMKVGVLGSVGIAMLLYTVISLTQKVESAFNYVWRVTRSRSLPRRFSDYLSVIMVGPVLAFSALGLTATMMNSTVVQQLMGIPLLGQVIVMAGKYMPFLLIISAFTFVYIFVPNTRVRLRSAFLGALVSGFLWQASGFGFAAFVANSGKYTAVYSGLAILMLFMIWLYLSWFILLLGAQISFFHQNPQQVRLGRRAFRFSARHKESAGLLLFYLLVEAYLRDQPRWTQDRLVQRMRLPSDAVAELLHPLEEAGLLLETGEEPPAFIPARDPHQIAVAEVLEVMREAEDSSQAQPALPPGLAQLAGLLREVDEARRQTLAGKTMADLVNVTEEPEPVRQKQG